MRAGIYENERKFGCNSARHVLFKSEKVGRLKGYLRNRLISGHPGVSWQTGNVVKKRMLNTYDKTSALKLPRWYYDRWILRYTDKLRRHRQKSFRPHQYVKEDRFRFAIIRRGPPPFPVRKPFAKVHCLDRLRVSVLARMKSRDKSIGTSIL